MYGPTLIELQIITGTNIDQISTVFTWLGAGGIVGSLTYGFLYDRFATAPIIVTTLALLCGVTCLIPVFKWIVTVMILCSVQAFLFNGISIGKLRTVHADITSKKKSRTSGTSKFSNFNSQMYPK